MFRFRLRTILFLTTVAGLAMGWTIWQQNIVKQRLRTLSELRLRKESKIVHIFNPSDVKEWDLPPRIANVSTLRRWFGDRPIGVIRFQHDAASAELEHVASLFPEAVVDKWSDPGEFFNLLDRQDDQ